jgi:hypothetical protein
MSLIPLEVSFQGSLTRVKVDGGVVQRVGRGRSPTEPSDDKANVIMSAPKASNYAIHKRKAFLHKIVSLFLFSSTRPSPIHLPLEPDFCCLQWQTVNLSSQKPNQALQNSPRKKSQNAKKSAQNSAPTNLSSHCKMDISQRQNNSQGISTGFCVLGFWNLGIDDSVSKVAMRSEI